MPVDSGCSLAHAMHKFLIWFYDEYSRYVHKMAWQENSNPSEVDDLVQEVWLRLCAKGDLLIKLSKERHLSYIATTVRNTAITMARHHTYEYPLEFAYSISYDEAETLNTVLDRKIRIQHFHQVWMTVPLSARELLERKYLLYENDEEIARDLGIKTSSVRMYLTRARKAACAILAQHKDELI